MTDMTIAAVRTTLLRTPWPDDPWLKGHTTGQRTSQMPFGRPEMPAAVRYPSQIGVSISSRKGYRRHRLASDPNSARRAQVAAILFCSGGTTREQHA